MALPWFSRILEFIGENASIITKKQTFIKNFYPVIYGYKIKTPQLPRLPQMTQNGNAKKFMKRDLYRKMKLIFFAVVVNLQYD